MVRIAFIGAGSMVFAKKIVSDILSFPELEDSELVLMDVDEHRLGLTEDVATAIIENGGVDATVEVTLDRRSALDGADYVLNMINVGGLEPFENEIRIPERYGVKQAIGDTLGPGGIFRALRTLPTMLDLAADMEDLCPDAVLLNYTNPMAPLCWALNESTAIDTVGLCHSVPHTVDAIAEYVGAPSEEIEYWVAGINHMAWFLECTWNGADVNALLEDAMKDEEIYRQDTVRFEILRHFGAFITESSHHMSEYVPYFRTDDELIESLSGTGYAKRMATAAYLEGWSERAHDRENTENPYSEAELVIERSVEYASRIIHSLETGQTRRLNLNVSNRSGAIENLPDPACVEVPCLVDGTGIHPCSVGELPPQLAALNKTNVNVQELIVKAGVETDRDSVYHAMKLDPLTAAVLSLDEIDELTTELLEANEAYLPDFE